MASQGIAAEISLNDLERSQLGIALSCQNCSPLRYCPQYVVLKPLDWQDSNRTLESQGMDAIT
jgi:hypothetical protein